MQTEPSPLNIGYPNPPSEPNSPVLPPACPQEPAPLPSALPGQPPPRSPQAPQEEHQPTPVPAVVQPKRQPNGKLNGGHAYPETVKDQARCLYIQGLGPMRIAATCGLPLNTVRRWVVTLNWSAQRTLVEANATKAATVIVQGSLNSVSKTLRAELAKELGDQIAALKRKPVKDKAELNDNRMRKGRASTVKTIVESANMVFGWETEPKVGLIVPMCGLQADQAPAIDIGSAPAQIADQAPATGPDDKPA